MCIRDSPYGKHFGFAKTSFLKDGVSCTVYVPHQREEQFEEEVDYSQFNAKATLNTRELFQFDPDNTFKIGENIQGGI